MVWKCVHGVALAYLSDLCVPATVIRSQVDSICDLQRLALYWFHARELQLDNEVSQSTDQPHGTVCHQNCGHGTCRRAPPSGQPGTENAPVLDRPAPLRRLHDSGAGYKYPDFLTYLLTGRAKVDHWKGSKFRTTAELS